MQVLCVFFLFTKVYDLKSKLNLGFDHLRHAYWLPTSQSEAPFSLLSARTIVNHSHGLGHRKKSKFFKNIFCASYLYVWGYSKKFRKLLDEKMQIVHSLLGMNRVKIYQPACG